MRAEEFTEAERERVRQAARAMAPLIEEVRRALSRAMAPPPVDEGEKDRPLCGLTHMDSCPTFVGVPTWVRPQR